MAIALPFLNTGPVVSYKDGVLRARSSVFQWLCSLCLGGRSFEADSHTRTITFRRRWFMLFRHTRSWSFDEIRRVLYTYRDIDPLAGLSWGGGDAIDHYVVALQLNDRHRSEVELFGWTGAGEFRNDGPFPDWFFPDEIIGDLTGTQDKESQFFFEVLRKLVTSGRHINPAIAPAAQSPFRESPRRRKPPVRPAPPPPS